MSYPASFYFSSKQEKTSYSHQPTGILDVNRLIKNQAPWKKMSFAKINKPKSLIIADWTLEHMPPKKLAAIELELIKLINQGFALYLWQKGDIKQITNENLASYLSCVEARGRVSAVFSDIIIQTAFAQHRLIKDQIQILDDYWLNLLFNPSQTRRQLDLNDLIKTTHNLNDIFEISKQVSPPITEIVHEEFSLFANALLKEIREGLPNVKTISNYKKIFINEFSLHQLINAGQTIIEDVTLDLSQLQKVKEFTFMGGELSARHFQALLAKITKLTSLNLSLCEGLSPNFTNGLSFENLKCLNIESSNIALSDLYNILKTAPKLKLLNLCNYKQLTENFSKEMSFRHLEELNVSQCNISNNDLRHILVQTSALKLLNLSHYKELRHNFTAGVNFSHLKVLDLSSCNVSEPDLRNILKQASTIRALKLANCKLPEGFTDKVRYTNLEVLDISKGTEISSEDLGNLLFQTPKLKELNLSGQYLTENFSDVAYFGYIERLNLSNSYITIVDLQSILIQAVKIKHLDLSFITYSMDNIFLYLYLDHLETLILDYTTINSAQLKALLTKLPHLKEISLLACPNLIVDSELQALLKNVKQLPFNLFNELIDLNLNEKVNTSSIKHSPESDNSIDADTESKPNVEYKIKRTFYPIDVYSSVPEVSEYRQAVYNSMAVNQTPCNLSEAFKTFNQGNAELKATDVTKIKTENELLLLGNFLSQVSTSEEDYYFGKQEFTLSNQWQALDSLSAAEELSHYFLEPEDAKVEIAYSERDNLYYIRGTDGQKVNISFLLKVNKQPYLIELPDFVQQRINKFRQFEEGALNLEGFTNPTGENYLSAILTQDRGACRHRAVAFKAYMERCHPDIPVRYVNNKCHAFVEVKIESQWIACDLGGYPAKLTIDESNNPACIANTDPSRAMTQSVRCDDKQLSKYGKYLATWEKAKPSLTTLPAYCQHVIGSSDHKKRLIEFDSSVDVYSMQLCLENYCRHTSRPSFYIHSPDDLVCSAPFIAREANNKGTLTKGPGGPLYDFLKAHQNTVPAPVLIVNYENFDSDDLVNFNGLLDKIPHADGTPLPKDTMVIGLLNRNKPDCYQESDFYSRFDEIESLPLESSGLHDYANQVAPLPLVEGAADVSERVSVINLYHASDWEERLLGRWEIQGDNLYFVEGELIEALALGLPIELQNAPWENDKFKHFWRQATLRGYIQYAGHSIKVPSSLIIQSTEGYDWQSLRDNMTADSTFTPGAETLNPSQLSDFFKLYQYEDKGLYSKPGLLDYYAKQDLPLHVNVTRSLTEDEWGMLLTACQKQEIKIIAHCATGVTIPFELEKPLVDVPVVLTQQIQHFNQNDRAIVSDDIGATLEALYNPNIPYQIIDVSECESEDLLVQTQGQLDREFGNLIFERKRCVVLQALEQGQKVILKGSFSESLVDALAPLLLARQHDKNAKGSLTLLSETPCFAYLPVEKHEVTTSEKKQLLTSQFSIEEIAMLDKELLAEESYNQLKARLTYLKYHSTPTNSQNTWQGLEGLSGCVKLTDFDEENSVAIAKAFNQARLDEINLVLSYSPYLFIAGLTGVGKSTFVEKNLNSPTDVLYQSEASLLAWASDKTQGRRKILFIDEANLSQKQFTEFEGLFNKPPTLLINGQLHSLTPEHKVIFAGNPVNYGDERQLSSLFKEHGKAVVFNPLPQEFIYEAILKPILTNTLNKAAVAQVSFTLLCAYRFLCECSEDTVLVSPRDVQMMGLLIVSFSQRNGPLNEQSVIKVAKYYAYQILANRVPVSVESLFNLCFKPDFDLYELTKPSLQEDFLFTSSRQPIRQQIDDLLDLRSYRQKNGLNDAQRYGGLGGLILEGEPGIGKSEFVLAILRAHGYEEVHINRDLSRPLPEKPFYRMPVSLSLDEKKALLNRAFDEGAVVIIDEINSSPMMERLLNDLLTGYNEKKQRPIRPGFLVIGTQNPVTMSGRRAPSTALARRLITRLVPTYTTEDMELILKSKGLNEKKVAKLIHYYEAHVKKAAQEHLTPAPTFRDLLRLVDDIIRAQKKRRHCSEEILDLDIELNNLIDSSREIKRSKLDDSKETTCVNLEREMIKNNYSLLGLFGTSTTDLDQVPMLDEDLSNSKYDHHSWSLFNTGIVNLLNEDNDDEQLFKEL